MLSKFRGAFRNCSQLDQFLGFKPPLATVVKTISTDEVIEKEETHSAHNYHPLPVAIAKAKGKWAEQALVTFYAICPSLALLVLKYRIKNYTKHS